METVSMQMTFPKSMVPYLADDDHEHAFERNAMILFPYIHNMTISHGRAAEILGVRKWDLIEFYNSMGLPYLNQSREELLAEMKTWDGFKNGGNHGERERHNGANPGRL